MIVVPRIDHRVIRQSEENLTDGMEEVAGDDDDVGASGDDALHRQAEGTCDVRLSLIDAGRGLAMVLPNPQVGVGEVSQSHTGNVM